MTLLNKRRVSDFRYANVLPSPLIEQYAAQTLHAIRFVKGFDDDAPWWKFERYVELDFDNAKDNAQARIFETCSQCGMCCKNIPTHQIAIYMSETELARARQEGHQVLVQGQVSVDDTRFHILSVTSNGDCAMLRADGCSLGQRKPLWCKMYHCEKYQGRSYAFEDKR